MKFRPDVPECLSVVVIVGLLGGLIGLSFQRFEPEPAERTWSKPIRWNPTSPGTYADIEGKPPTSTAGNGSWKDVRNQYPVGPVSRDVVEIGRQAPGAKQRHVGVVRPQFYLQLECRSWSGARTAIGKHAPWSLRCRLLRPKPIY